MCAATPGHSPVTTSVKTTVGGPSLFMPGERKKERGKKREKEGKEKEYKRKKRKINISLISANYYDYIFIV